jgi:hypothetical protein
MLVLTQLVWELVGSTSEPSFFDHGTAIAPVPQAQGVRCRSPSHPCRQQPSTIAMDCCTRTDSSAEPAYVVALSPAQYGSGYPGPNCYRSITITSARGGFAYATVKDECPDCEDGSMQVGEALYRTLVSSIELCLSSRPQNPRLPDAICFEMRVNRTIDVRERRP